MIRLLLADDHAMLREGLRSKFQGMSDIEVVAEASTAADTLAMLKTAKPNVIVLDMKLPDANGLTLLPQIKSVLPPCRIVVLTMYDHVRYAIHALEGGADAFVVKGAPFEELVQAVRTVARNGTFVSSGMASKFATHLKKGKAKGTLESLSQREFEVLILMGNGLAVKEIAAQLGVSEKSVTTYRTRVMEKLNLSNKVDLVRYVLESGLVE